MPKGVREGPDWATRSIRTFSSKVCELDRVAQKLDGAACVLFNDAVGFGRSDLCMVSPSDGTCGLSESVTEARISKDMD